jgi:lipid II:glycine glycyltransferase (peptidoglycan interpeptide bridge formation enzyme)
LAATFGDALKIRTASHRERPIAAILTLKSETTLVYKYGCSDESEHNLGGMQMLMWRAIQEAKQEGLGVLDLGRSDASNEGLVAYKDRWGARRSTLIYLRRPLRLRATASASSAPMSAGESWKIRLAGQLFSYAPGGIAALAGRLLYRHLG